MSNFEKWDKEFRAQNLYAFNNNANALLWLKVRAVCRGKQIDQFLNDNELTLTSTKYLNKTLSCSNYWRITMMPSPCLTDTFKVRTMSGTLQ